MSTLLDDHSILTYALHRVEEETARTTQAADFRRRMLTPFVVVLRDEGGLSWRAISAELGVSTYAARETYEWAGGDPS